jgi:hypothetical protein
MVPQQVKIGKSTLEQNTYYLLAVLISSFALLVSIAAAAFSYKQYRLNLARDQRALQRERDERLPWITIRANKMDNQPRSWLVYCTFQNRSYGPVGVKRISLSKPESSQLAETILADVGAIQRYQPVNPFGHSVCFDNFWLELTESRELVLMLIVGSHVELAAGTKAKLQITFAFRDNEDTSVYVDRAAQLV